MEPVIGRRMALRNLYVCTAAEFVGRDRHLQPGDPSPGVCGPVRDAGIYMIDLHEESISQPSLTDL